jgi:hypothetical protein
MRASRLSIPRNEAIDGGCRLSTVIYVFGGPPHFSTIVALVCPCTL